MLLENKSSKLKQGMHEDATSSYYKDTSKLIETVCNKKAEVVESDRRVALGVQCMVKPRKCTNIQIHTYQVHGLNRRKERPLVQYPEELLELLVCYFTVILDYFSLRYD